MKPAWAPGPAERVLCTQRGSFFPRRSFCIKASGATFFFSGATARTCWRAQYFPHLLPTKQLNIENLRSIITIYSSSRKVLILSWEPRQNNATSNLNRQFRECLTVPMVKRPLAHCTARLPDQDFICNIFLSFLMQKQSFATSQNKKAILQSWKRIKTLRTIPEILHAPYWYLM